MREYQLKPFIIKFSDHAGYDKQTDSKNTK